MSNTRIGTQLVKDGSINKDDLDITTSGKSVIRKLIAGSSNISLSQTGADPGTGDVTIDLSLTDVVITANSLATANTTKLLLQNTTPATSGSRFQDPPQLEFKGQVWGTTAGASKEGGFAIGIDMLSTASVVQENLVIYSNSGGVYTSQFIMDAGGGINAGGFATSGNVQGAAFQSSAMPLLIKTSNNITGNTNNQLVRMGTNLNTMSGGTATLLVLCQTYSGQTGAVTNRELVISPYYQTTSGTNYLIDAGTNSATAGLITNHTSKFSVTSRGDLFLANVPSAPGTPSGGGVLYVESGALKYKGSSGTVTTLGAA